MRKKIVILALFFLLVIASIIILPYYKFLTQTLKISLFKTLFSFDSLKVRDDQVNILVLGIAGAEHEGPNLSDSIMVLNYNFKTNQLTSFSFPRDIWSATLSDKINSAYAYGEAKMKGGGLKLAKAEMEAVFGQRIPYAAVVNFSEFEELIDFFGGIDVVVDRSFTDKKYPIAGKENDPCDGDPEYACRYETISFAKGINHMDGKTALKFARSRNAEGIEGNDFARAKRQQKIVEAVKDKLIAYVKNARLKELEKLFLTLDKLIIRDLTNQQAAIIAKNIFLKKNFRQKQVVLTEDFFTVPDYSDYDGKYVLVPKSGNFNLIHQYIACIINDFSNCEDLKNKGNKNQ